MVRFDPPGRPVPDVMRHVRPGIEGASSQLLEDASSKEIVLAVEGVMRLRLNGWEARCRVKWFEKLILS